LRLLGLPRIVTSGRADHVLERRDAALLAMLLLRGPTPRAQAAEGLWPGLPAQKARTNLRQRLFRLKQALGAELVQGQSTLQLAPGLAHDLQEPALAVWMSAQESVLLGGLDYGDCGALGDWVEEARAQWRQQRRTAWASHAEALEAAGRLAEALPWAQGLALDHAASEHAHRRVMRLHYRRGDRGAALAAFRACQQALLREAGAGPGDETLALASLIERSAELAVVGRQDSPATAALAAALMRPPQLVGREAEWQALAASQGRGQWLLLEGEAGIGKSRLAEDFARSCGPLQCVKSYAGDDRTPYAMLARALRVLLPQLPQPPDWARAELARLLPELGAAPEPRLEALRLRQALTEALKDWGDRGLGSLVLDDLQWADAASLDSLLAWLAPASPGLPWVVLVMRSGEPAAALRTWVAEQSLERLFTLKLGPLPAPAIAAFVQALDLPQADASARQALAQTLMQRTGGRPLFMLELLRAGGGRLSVDGSPVSAEPRQLLAMIEARLLALSAPALKLARVAALMGPAFSVALAAQVLQLHVIDLVEPLRELQAAQLMGEHGLAFDLAQEALLGSVPEAIAALLHRSIAAALQQQHTVAPSRVAFHWAAAGEWLAAARQFERAAGDALAASRRVEELGFLDRAAQAYAGAGSPDDVFRVAHLALNAAMSVETPAATQARVDALQDMAGDEGQRLTALLAASRYRLCLSDGAGALLPSGQALRLAQARGRPDLETVAAGWHGMALTLTGDIAQGLACCERARGTAERLDDVRARLDFHGAYGYVLFCSARYTEALAPLRLAAALAESLGDLSEAMEQQCNVAVCLTSLGDREAALATGEQMLGLWRRMGEPPGLVAATNHLHLATSYYALGRYREALDLLPWALAQFRQGEAPAWVVVTENRLARVYLRLGQIARARQVMTPLPAGANAGNRAARRVLVARLDSLAGKPVLHELLAAHSELSDTLDLADRCSFELLLASLLPPDEALVWCGRVLGRVAADNTPVRMHAGLRQADALRRLGRHLEAARHATAAVAFAPHSSALDMDPAELWWLAFQALRDAGDPAGARHALEHGRAWIESCLPHVPEAFMPSFLERNPFNRALMSARLSNLQADRSAQPPARTDASMS